MRTRLRDRLAQRVRELLARLHPASADAHTAGQLDGVESGAAEVKQRPRGGAGALVAETRQLGIQDPVATVVEGHDGDVSRPIVHSEWGV